MSVEDELKALAPRLLAEAEASAAGLSLRTKLEAFALLAVVSAVCLWWLTRDPPPVPEDVAPAPAVRQVDGSLEAERAPDAHPPAPPHVIPKGFHEVRRESIVVAPAPAASSVQVDLSLVRNGAEQRVIASSPDGQVLKAIDIPIEAAMLPAAPRPWAAGLGYTTEREVGVWVERDVGRLRLGAEVLKGAGKPRAEVRVGVTW